MPTQAPNALPVSMADLAMRDQAARNAYYASLSPQQQAAARSQYAAYQMQVNRSYMRNTVSKKAVAPQSSGGSFTQNFAAGAQLAFTVPSANNGFMDGFYVRLNLSVTPATGTSAAYALNAGAPLTLIDNIVLNYNGVQHRFRPYIIKTLSQLSKYVGYGVPYTPVAGQTVASRTAYRNSGQPLSVGSANTWTFEFFVPLNLLHPHDARGLLPIMAGETQAQVIVTCAPQVLGVDPILNTIAATTGSGHAVTVTGTIQVIASYRDGLSLLSPQRLGLDLSGLGTVQFQQDIPLTGITAGNVFRQKLTIMDDLRWVLLTLVDGNQSNKFSSDGNLQVIEFAQDSTGASAFWKYGTGTNMSVQEFFIDQFRAIGQDTDEGIIPLVTGPITQEADPANLEGTAYLNTSMSGWTDARYGVQFGSVGSVAGITPRVEVHSIFLNSRGLISS